MAGTSTDAVTCFAPRCRYLADFEWIMARQVDFGASNATVANQVVAGAVWPGFNDTFVPSYWNGGNTRVIARTVDAGTFAQLSVVAVHGSVFRQCRLCRWTKRAQQLSRGCRFHDEHHLAKAARL